MAPSRKEFSFSSTLSVGSGFKLFIPDALARHNKKEKYGEKKYIRGMGNIWGPTIHNRG